MKVEANNSLAARRKFMGDFSLTTTGTSVLSVSEQRRLNLYDRRRHHRPADIFPAHILPHLYLGNDDTAKNKKLLNRCGIRHVINVTSNLPNYFEDEPGFHYLRIPVNDCSSQNLFQFFPEAIAFIDKAHSEGCSVLVHCWAGLSRSVTVCLAYIMYVMNSPLEEAFDQLLKLNGAIAPNFHFLETLTCWERLLVNERTAPNNILGASSSLPSSSTVSIASSSGASSSPIIKEFPVGNNTEFNDACQPNYILHIPCHKTASSPTIFMNFSHNNDNKSSKLSDLQNCQSNDKINVNL